MAKKQIFERKQDTLSNYLSQLDELLKRNKGGGLYEAYDVNPRAFRIGGKVVDPSGLGQDIMKDELKYSAYEPGIIPMEARGTGLDFMPQFDVPDFPTEFQRYNPASQFNDPRYQEALNQPVQLSQDEKDEIYQATGKSYGIQQLKDGGILYNDGLIRYDDGTVREYTGQDAQPISSQADGTVMYSDGSYRRPANKNEMDVQSDEPAYPIASQADGTVMYSDGVARAFDPNEGRFKQYDSGVINFFDTFDQGYRFQPRGNDDLTGQCFTSGHLVSMSDGTYKEIQNIKEGDNVLSSDGSTINKVVKTMNREADTIKLTTSLSEFEVTPEHPFLTDSGFVEVKDLKENDKILIPIKENIKSGLSTNELKWLGFWLGDGDVYRETKSNALIFRLTVSDKKKDFVSNLNIDSNSRPHSTHKTTDVNVLRKRSHKKLVEILNSCFDEDMQKQLPLIFNKEEYSSIIDGYLNADGYKQKDNYYEVNSVSKKLIYSIQKASIIAGYKPTLVKTHKRDNKEIIISGKKVNEIKPIYRLYIDTDKNNQHALVTSKTSGKKDVVYNLEVSGDNTYICNNHAVHNCAWFSEQITTLPDGSDWRIGNTIEDKKAYLQNYMAGGYAYAPGEQDAKTGHSIVFDEGTRYGHVATISEIFRGADGQLYYRLTESNYAAPNTVTHDRVVSANDPKIVGILKTVPREGYQKVSWEEAPQVSGERALAVQNNASTTGQQERRGEATPEDRVIQEAPKMSMAEPQPQPQEQAQPQQQVPEYLGQTINENIIQPAIEPLRNVGEALQPMSPQRQEAGAGVNELGLQLAQKGIGSNIGNTPQGFIGLGEVIAGDLPSAGRELSSTIERLNPTPRIDTGISEALRGDFAGAGKNFANTLSRVSNRIAQVPEQIASEVVKPVYAEDGSQRPATETLGDNLKGVASSIGQYVGAKAGEGIEALKGKASNLFQKTPLMGLFQGQKQVGDAKGSTLIDTSGGKENTDNRDAFFKFGGSQEFGDYLVNNADQVKGGALDTSLFKSDFFQDPNRVANVFGNTSQGQKATGIYKDYLSSQIKPGFNEPYRTEQRQEGDTLYEYKIPVPEYFQNQYFQNIISQTPDVLSSGFSYDKFQLPTTTKTASAYKGEAPVDSKFNPVFKTGALDLFRKSGSKTGQLAGDILKSPADVYKSSTPSMSYDIPQASKSLFSIPSQGSYAIPATQRTVIRQTPKAQPSLSDYLSRGKTEAQWYAETGQQNVADQMGKAQAYTAPQARKVGSTTGSGVQKVTNASGRTVTAQPGYNLRVDSSGETQRVENKTAKLPGGQILNFEAPTKTVSAQLAQVPSTKKNNWLQELFKKIF